jgi:hypothetical protein
MNKQAGFYTFGVWLIVYIFVAITLSVGSVKKAEPEKNPENTKAYRKNKRENY